MTRFLTLIVARQAARAADAMEGVARAMGDNSQLMSQLLHKQLRAYIAVETGNGAIYQDANYRFGSKPVILNTGFTPALKVRYRVQGQILPVNLPPDYAFDDGPLVDNDAALAPRQMFTINAVVPQRIPDADVAAVMDGLERRLFVWGSVIYEDIFGEEHETKFCHNFMFFRPDPNNQMDVKVNSFYHFSHNQMG